MLVEDVGLLFRQWADEGDETFQTKADTTTFLRLGYRRFQGLIKRILPHFYNTTVIITLADADTYNLETAAVKILGLLDGALTNARMMNLVKVSSVDSSAAWIEDWSGAADWTELRTHTNAYLLEDTTLYFSRKYTGDIRLHYAPEESIAWANNEAADVDTFIDDASYHHDLIAIYAYEYYAPKDFADSPLLKDLKRDREKDLRVWLYGRVKEQSDHLPFVA